MPSHGAGDAPEKILVGKETHVIRDCCVRCSGREAIPGDLAPAEVRGLFVFMVLKLALGVLLSLFLLWARGCQAQCSEGSLDVVCICYNDDSCVNVTTLQLEKCDGDSDPNTSSDSLGSQHGQMCTCEQGVNVPFKENELAGIPPDVTSLYMSGDIDSLNPLTHVFTGQIRGAVVFKHTSVQSLEPLRGLESVGGLAIISNEKLIDLRGLENLTRVDGSLIIHGNTNLANLRGLENLSRVKELVSIKNNSNLASLRGFEKLEEVNGSLIIDGNAQLKDTVGLNLLNRVHENCCITKNGFHEWNGLQGLRTVDRNFILKLNHNLEKIRGFAELGTVGGNLSIQLNSKLVSINSFANVTNIGNNLCIENNRGLANFRGFQKLTEVGGSLKFTSTGLKNIRGPSTLKEVGGVVRILFNPSLVMVKGFDNLARVGTVFMYNNPELMAVNGFGSLTNVEDNVSFRKNAKLEVIPKLQKLTTVNGSFVLTENSVVIISGPSSLEKIGRGVEILNNPKLVRVRGFDNLTRVGHIWMQNNSKLIEVKGFDSLTHADNNVLFSNNTRLEVVPTFQKLLIVYGTLGFLRNNVTIISGLSSLEKVTGDMQVLNNPNLVRIRGFDSLTYLGGAWFRENPQLKDIDGFGVLEETKRYLLIKGNTNLKHLRGFKNLRRVGTNLAIHSTAIQTFNVPGRLTRIDGNLEIQSNPVLTDVRIPEKLTSVGNQLRIWSNDGLESFNLSPIYNVAGELSIISNNALKSVIGDDNLTTVGGLHISGNPNLTMLSGLEGLKEINGSLRVENNGKIGGRGAEYLGNLARVRHNLLLTELYLHDSDFQEIKVVGGSLLVQNCTIKSFGELFQKLEKVGGSLKLESNVVEAENRPTGELFPNLSMVCYNRAQSESCGLVIKKNKEYHSVDDFPELVGINGSLIITGNMNLTNVANFNKLKFINTTIPTEGEAEDLFGGLVIAFNPVLENVTGFDSLTEVVGVLPISRNPSLGKIILSNLSQVASISKIEGNSDMTPEFTSIEPLPSLETGCRNKENVVPREELIFETQLRKDVCLIEVLIPTLVGTGIIVFMLVISFMLFLYMLVDFYSPYRQRMSKERLKEMFAAHLLALADVLSDIGFIITVFVLWDTKIGESRKHLFIIGTLSSAVLVISQVYTMCAVYMGLTSRKLARDVRLDVSLRSLLEYLKEGRGMCKADWLILFPGLMVLDAEVIKHLPWGREMIDDTNKMAEDGFPHKYFANVAFVAGYWRTCRR